MPTHITASTSPRRVSGLACAVIVTEPASPPNTSTPMETSLRHAGDMRGENIHPDGATADLIRAPSRAGAPVPSGVAPGDPDRRATRAAGANGIARAGVRTEPGRTEPEAAYGDADIAPIAALFADASRTRVLMALADGRALPASLLAAEAGLSPQGVSAHLAKLRAAGLIDMEKSGRNRYYRLSGPAVADVLEAMARLAPARPVRSLREGTRARALRAARTCYDHLAGRLGTALTQGLLDRGALVTTDGDATTGRRPGDRLSAPLAAHPYELGPHAEAVFGSLGVDLPGLRSGRSHRPLLRFCMDWTEQRHHLAGRLGAALTTALLDAGWLIRAQPPQRAVRLTDPGRTELSTRLGLDLD